MNKKTNCIIGLGSPFYHDDGIGIFLLEQLEKQKPPYLVHYDLIDGGTGGFNLLHYLDSYAFVMIIDAVDFSAKPGSLQFFTPEQVQTLKKNTAKSAHCHDFLQIIDTARKMNRLPKNLIIAGIQPADTTFGEGLSHFLLGKLDEINKQLKDYLLSLE